MAPGFERSKQFEENPKSPWEDLPKPEILEIAGKDVEVYDVSPENLKTEVPTVVAPAWGVRPDVYRYNIGTLVDAGRRVISVDAPHGVETEKEEDLPMAELRKMAAIMETVEAKGIEKVDVVAHSEGALYMTIAATLHPERFRNTVLVDPAGIIGEDNIMRLGKGFGEDAALEAERRKTKTDRDATDPAEFQRTILSSPLKSLREIFAISGADIREMLRNLKEKGIGISVIHAIDDKGFPMERVQFERLPGESEKVFKARVEKIKANDPETAKTIKGNVDTSMVDGFYSVQGTHNEIIQRPELYTKLVEHALEAMEKKQEKQRGQEAGA